MTKNKKINIGFIIVLIMAAAVSTISLYQQVTLRRGIQEQIRNDRAMPH